MIDMTQMAGAVGALAFMVSLITEVTKDVGPLKKMPTDLQVILLGVLLSELAMAAYVDAQGLILAWYMPVLALPAGFIVAFVARYGWTAFHELKGRFLSGAPGPQDSGRQ